MKSSYQTISIEASIKYVEKKSVFLAHSFLVTSETQAQQLISDAKKKYWDATHNVYAYYISGEETQVSQKFSDDGEPSGTAGLPVLDSIRKANLENTLIIVTRYFGGIQLGAPGLVRAYSKAASMCLDESAVVTKLICTSIKLNFEYSLLEKIQKFLLSKSIETASIVYKDVVEMDVLVPVDITEIFASEIFDLTQGVEVITKSIL